MSAPLEPLIARDGAGNDNGDCVFCKHKFDHDMHFDSCLIRRAENAMKTRCPDKIGDVVANAKFDLIGDLMGKLADDCLVVLRDALDAEMASRGLLRDAES